MLYLLRSTDIQKMGNCIGTSSCALSFTNKKVSPHEDDQQFKASPAGKESSSREASHECMGPLPLSALLKSGEVQLDIGDGGQRMKIVVNKKQLKLLITRLEELNSKHVVVQSVRKKARKWRPSLATIPEL